MTKKGTFLGRREANLLVIENQGTPEWDEISRQIEEINSSSHSFERPSSEV